MYNLILMILMWFVPSPPPLMVATPIVVTIAPEVITYADRYTITYRLSKLILSNADKYNIPHDIAFQLVYTESRFNSRARGLAGEVGLGQILPSTARTMEPDITIQDLYDPATNLDVSFKYLGGLMDMFREQAVQRAVASYNRGPKYGHTASSYRVASLMYVNDVMQLDK